MRKILFGHITFYFALNQASREIEFLAFFAPRQTLGGPKMANVSHISLSQVEGARPNGQIIYENNASEFLVKNLNFGMITISITDDNNRLINFNGISSYFVLKFNIFRRSIKKPLKFENLVEYINQIPIEVSADIFDYMMKFVSYSFNKCLGKNTIVHTKERGRIKTSQAFGFAFSGAKMI
jgi:hypothetical protein